MLDKSSIIANMCSTDIKISVEEITKREYISGLYCDLSSLKLPRQAWAYLQSIVCQPINVNTVPVYTKSGDSIVEMGHIDKTKEHLLKVYLKSLGVDLYLIDKNKIVKTGIEDLELDL